MNICSSHSKQILLKFKEILSKCKIFTMSADSMSLLWLYFVGEQLSELWIKSSTQRPFLQKSFKKYFKEIENAFFRLLVSSTQLNFASNLFSFRWPKQIYVWVAGAYALVLNKKAYFTNCGWKRQFKAFALEICFIINEAVLIFTNSCLTLEII